MGAIPENCDVCAFFGADKCLHDHGNHIDILDSFILPDRCPIKEDVLDAKRFRVWYRTEQFYLIISTLEGKPWEIFVEHAISGQHSLQYMLASWDCNTRFISMALKTYPLEKVIKQLSKSSRQKNDLPYIIAEKLKDWV